jgi:hypothetical protein
MVQTKKKPDSTGPKKLFKNAPNQNTSFSKHKKTKSEVNRSFVKGVTQKVPKKRSDKENQSINIGSGMMPFPQGKHSANISSVIIPHGSNNQGHFDRARKSKEEVLQQSIGKIKDKPARF